MTEIELQGVSYVYSPGTPFEKKALNNINIGFESGIITGIIGHTGSGKSTLVQLFNGLLKPTTGKVFVKGRDIWSEPKKMSDIRFRVGLVFQYPEYQLFEETVYRDIAYGPTNMGLDKAEIDRRVKLSVEFTGLSPSVLDKSPFELSGGQKRRVAIAGIMAMQPSVLVLDEPAAGLDPVGRKEIFQGISEYRRNTNSTIIIVSHSMEDIAHYCDKVLVMNNSEVFRYGSCDEIFKEASQLTNIGLDIPQISRFVLALREKEIDIPKDIYTIEHARREILALLNSKGGNTNA